jgi:hypothetical protein
MRLARLAPLTGALFAVLTLISFFVGGESPDAGDSPLKVLTYFTVHKSRVETTTILGAYGFLFAVFWVGVLASYLRRNGAPFSLASLVVAGGVLMAVSIGLFAGVEYALAHEAHKWGPQTVQTMNVLNNTLFVPIVIGGCVYGVASGLAILGGVPLPNWLGWVALVVGIVTAIPPIGFFALLVLLVWTLIVSVLIYSRDTGVESARVQPAAAA